ncbi:hypothetical protein HYS48_02990, partial [Candidatus Woesearchaeota archaeon]|nr:hypothetical protein [Candidatus Woesearchaeota archaeon]
LQWKREQDRIKKEKKRREDRRKTLEKVLEHIRANGPTVVKNLHARLQVWEAERLVQILREEGQNLEVYDVPSTVDVWDGTDSQGTPYRVLATRKLIMTLSYLAGGKDYTKPEDFRELLQYFSARRCKETKISQWGTTLAGMLSSKYGDSHIAAILETIDVHSDFAAIREKGIDQADFPHASVNTWQDKEGNPTALARKKIGQLVETLARTHGIEQYTTPEGFRKLLQYLTVDAFYHTPINFWGTTLGSAIHAHSDSHVIAVRSLIENDEKYAALRGWFTESMLKGPVETREKRAVQYANASSALPPSSSTPSPTSGQG